MDCYAYVTDSQNGLRIIDISDPEHPYEVSFCDTGYATGITVVGDFAFVTHTQSRFVVVDISNPELPYEVETYDPAGLCWDVAIRGDYSYVERSFGLLILDVSYFTNPQPEIAVSPEALEFGEVEFRRSAELTLTVSNIGNADLTVSDISTAGDYFSVNFADEFTLAQDASQAINVTFTPNATGELSGQVIITSDDPYDPEVTVDLTGTGVWVTPQELLGRLTGRISELVDAGSLNSGQGNALTVKLEHAIRRLDRRQINPAINQLNAFINQVEDFINEGILTQDEGEPLIDEVEFIIELLINCGIDGFGELVLSYSEPIPSNYYLSQAYPNPFNSLTRFSYGLPEDSHVSIRVFDVTGRLVANLVDGEKETGIHHALWEAKEISAGVYIVRLATSDFMAVQKAVLVT